MKTTKKKIARTWEVDKIEKKFRFSMDRIRLTISPFDAVMMLINISCLCVKRHKFLWCNATYIKKRFGMSIVFAMK